MDIIFVTFSVRAGSWRDEPGSSQVDPADLNSCLNRCVKLGEVPRSNLVSKSQHLNNRHGHRQISATLNKWGLNCMSKKHGGALKFSPRAPRAMSDLSFPLFLTIIRLFRTQNSPLALFIMLAGGGT